ncbi:MAG TPA: winged helix-turn-helix domain-containing protein [Thermoanaerobaculia bacterium]|nr:winged helix-turn-helix domain-containing protein [Thermoanaerobaculia bacterium]
MSGAPRLRFGDFELRPGSGELLRAGEPVKLQPQPLKVLELLARRSREVVSREEIRQAVWGDAFVDFDASLNFSIKEIRRALGDSATSPRFVETVPRRGYRFLASVDAETQGGAAPPKATHPAPPAGLQRLGKGGASIVLLVLLTLLAGNSLRPVAERLSVLPLTCRSQDLADRQVCTGLSDALTVELSRQLSGEIDVIAPFSAQVYAGKKPSEILRGLKPDVVLTGEATPSATGLRLAFKLARSTGGETLWSHSFDAELQDAPLLYREVARQVSRALDLPPLPLRPARPKPAAGAYETYLRAVSLRHQMQYKPAEAAFQDAVLEDAGFAPAWAELALCRVRNRDEIGATEAAAHRAVTLDPHLAEAHVAVAQVLFRHNLDWEGAGREYRLGLALNPTSPNAYSAYSYYLISLGRIDEALAIVRRARELNPASMELGATFAWYLYLDHRFQEVLREIPATLELYSLNAAVTTDGARRIKNTALETLVTSSLMMGDRGQALQAAKEIEEMFGGPAAAARLRTLDDFWRARERRMQNGVLADDPFGRAKDALMLGDRNRALDLLTSDCTPEGWTSPYAAVEPLFDSLHSDPRWPQVLDCLKLPADAPARRMKR